MYTILKKLYSSLLITGLALIGAGKCYAQGNIQFTNQNAFLGNGAGIQNMSGANNVFVGYNAGRNSTTGQANVFIGSQAGLTNTTGLGNLFLGQQAGASNTTGNYNLFMGNGAGNRTTTGSDNTTIGDGASLSNSTGSRNTSIGKYAGINNTTGSDNTFIGFAATAPSSAGNLSNAGAIGANAQVAISNALVLGNNVNVGIGNTAPNNRLEITKGSSNKSGLRLTNLTSSSPASVINQTKFLTVNLQGDVVLGSLNSSTREGVSDELWQRNGQFLQNTQDNAVIIGKGISKTSSDYNLFVSKGILTEKVKVAVKNTADWSDKVFEADYGLKPLPEVEQYIQVNKHLSGIPSVIEVIEHGIDVAKMDAKLLEKIEELTLYSIQLEKANRELRENDKKQQAISDRQQVEIDELKQAVKQLAAKK